jgi:hypothetical protein
MPRAKIAHRSPGRIRLKLDTRLTKEAAETLINDLKVSPDVSNVTLRGTSLIIEHSDDDHSGTAIGRALDKLFPEFDRWSNNLDAQIAEATSDPWVNKFVPLGFLGLAVFTGISNGAVLAGESAFALGYVAFDLYWKFQQENVVRKIEQGLSKQQQKDMDETSA